MAWYAPPVDQLTTRIVGKMEKFDQRDIQHTKAAIGSLGEKVQERWTSESIDPFRRIFYPENRPRNAPIRSWVSVADGPLNPQRVEVENPRRMSEIIKEVARFLGAELVGICELDQTFVYSHKGLRIDFHKGKDGQPVNITHKYAISLGQQMGYERFRYSPSFIDNAEVGKGYLESGKVAVSLAAYIRELGWSARGHFHMAEEVMHVPIAVMAGLGELARNGSIISREFGPRMRFATVTTDLPLAIDKPVDIGVQKLCSECDKCAVNCPAQAILYGDKVVTNGIERWQVDNDACMTYWTANRNKWNDCGRCIAVCPWNKPLTWWHKAATWVAPRSRLGRKALLWLDDRINGKKPKPKQNWLYYRVNQGERNYELRVVR